MILTTDPRTILGIGVLIVVALIVLIGAVAHWKKERLRKRAMAARGSSDEDRTTGAETTTDPASPDPPPVRFAPPEPVRLLTWYCPHCLQEIQLQNVPTGSIQCPSCDGTIEPDEFLLNNRDPGYNEAGFVDPRTGMYRYEYMRRRMGQEVLRCSRAKSDCVLLVIRVINFERIPWHMRTDFLKRIGDVSSQGLRSSDLVGCWTRGDLFAVVLFDTSMTSSWQVVVRLLAALMREIVANTPQSAELAFKPGIASFATHGVGAVPDPLSAMIRHAEQEAVSDSADAPRAPVDPKAAAAPPAAPLPPSSAPQGAPVPLRDLPPPKQPSVDGDGGEELDPSLLESDPD